MTGILQPTIRFDDFERIGRGHQDLREQRIRIERDRCKQLVELFGFEDRRGFGFGFGGRCFRCGSGCRVFSYRRRHKGFRCRHQSFGRGRRCWVRLSANRRGRE